MYDLATEHPEDVVTEMTFMDIAKENGWVQDEKPEAKEKSPGKSKKKSAKETNKSSHKTRELQSTQEGDANSDKLSQLYRANICVTKRALLFMCMLSRLKDVTYGEIIEEALRDLRAKYESELDYSKIFEEL